MFYIPECGEHYFNLKKLIEDHGGMVVEQHECYTFQIKPESAKLKMKDFYFAQKTCVVSDFLGCGVCVFLSALFPVYTARLVVYNSNPF